MSGIFGSTQGTKKMARPLSYAPAGYGLRGLGAFSGGLGASTIPGDCWDAAGFKDCHAKAFAEAQAECAGGMARDNYGGDMDTCIERNADAYAWAGCVGKYCPQSTKPTASGASTFSWRNTSPNATVKKLQSALNPLLAANGANKLVVDGILGSGTCGAAYWIDGVAGTSFYTDYGLAQICKALTMPTKAGTKTPVQTIAVTPQTTITKTESFTEETNLPWDKFHADTKGVQQRLNTMLDAADMNLLTVNGVLNSPTCGAMKWGKDTQGIDLLSVQGQNCQGFTAPTKRTKVASPVLVADTKPAVLPTAPTRTSAASMATTGLIVGVVALGGYFLNKKYHWFG